jgi:hypothetical protein
VSSGRERREVWRRGGGEAAPGNEERRTAKSAGNAEVVQNTIYLVELLVHLAPPA